MPIVNEYNYIKRQLDANTNISQQLSTTSDTWANPNFIHQEIQTPVFDQFFGNQENSFLAGIPLNTTLLFGLTLPPQSQPFSDISQGPQIKNWTSQSISYSDFLESTVTLHTSSVLSCVQETVPSAQDDNMSQSMPNSHVLDSLVKQGLPSTSLVTSSIHKSISSTKDNAPPTAPKKHACEHCNKIFPYMSNLKVHLRSHSGSRPFACKQCLKSYTTAGRLNEHMLTHKKEKPHLCEECDKAYTQKCSLRRHIAKHHKEFTLKTRNLEKKQLDIVRVKCNDCGKSFLNNTTLLNHITGIHLIK